MIPLETIREMSRKIVDAFDPERVILFGSYARGQASEASDVDLLVVARDNRPRPKRSVPIYRLLRDYPFGKDILVYTPEEVDDYRGLPASLIGQALAEGIILHQRES